MPFFEYILILLAAVLLSNLINRFIPALSVPIVQIILGILVALIPFGAFSFEFKLDPELFFLMFIAPFVFYSGMTGDRKTLWEMKKPILGSSVLLVFATTIAVGYFLHTIIPSIPLAAAFALIAALGPTDDVAVAAVAKRVAVPRKIMAILSGESMLNDASGIVCFQFAIAVMITGGFSVLNMAGQFMLVGLGGVLAGFVLTLLKSVLVKWLRSLGIDNITLHILIGLLTPFIIYMVAEALSVSGILAVFTAGIAHSFMRDTFNPETVNLNVAQESVWSVFSFTLEGLVFVMLGTQLPDILKTIGEDKYNIGAWQIAGYILALTFIFVATRFAWWTLAVSKKTYQELDEPIGKIKAGIIFSFAGARGMVSLAGVMSIPLLLANGNAFPERDLIILLASGVIIVSLLLTNFVLPLFIERKAEAAQSEAEQAACAEIIQKVASKLISESTDETRTATGKILRSYYSRDAAPRKNSTTLAEQSMMEQILLWEKENTLAVLDSGVVDKEAGKHYLNLIDSRLKISSLGKMQGFLYRIKLFVSHVFSNKRYNLNSQARKDFAYLLTANVDFILSKLKQMRTAENGSMIDKLIYSYELMALIHRRHSGRHEPENSEESDFLALKIAMRGFQIEREQIQDMFEAGRISWKTAKEMRSNIAAIETRIQAGK